MSHKWVEPDPQSWVGKRVRHKLVHEFVGTVVGFHKDALLVKWETCSLGPRVSSPYLEVVEP